MIAFRLHTCFVRAVPAATSVMVLVLAGCNQPDTAPPPMATPRAAPAEAAPPPTTAPAPPLPTGPPASPLDLHTQELPAESFLRIERLHENAAGGWVSGNGPAPNRIVIETENVAQFALDLSHFALDWSTRVWMRIDQAPFELTHQPNPVIHLRETSPGIWELVDSGRR